MAKPIDVAPTNPTLAMVAQVALPLPSVERLVTRFCSGAVFRGAWAADSGVGVRSGAGGSGVGAGWVVAAGVLVAVFGAVAVDFLGVLDLLVLPALDDGTP